MSAYQPGRCNIGRRQRRRRLLVAATAFVAAGLTAVATAAGLVPEPALLATFVFLAVGFEYGFQAITSFCVRLALLSRYDFRGEGGEAGSVGDSSARYDDQVQAAKITVAALVLAALTTLLLFLLS